MRLLFLGISDKSIETIKKVKHIPGYGQEGELYIYHNQVLINSLSYGDDMVVEVPDPHGDGYRTLKDGFQALREYSTTVSDYVGWLIEEIENGSVHMVVDFLDDSQEANNLRKQIKDALPENAEWLYEKDYDVDALVSEIARLNLNGKDWFPFEYSQEFWKEAEGAWETAQVVMAENHVKNKKKIIENFPVEQYRDDFINYQNFNAIPKFDRDILDKYVVAGEVLTEKLANSRTEYYDENHKCTIIEHDLLDKFFGWHHTEYAAARVFRTPYIEIESAKYVRYESDDSTPIIETESEFVIEYVHRGNMKVRSNDADWYVELEGGQESSGSYAYMPAIDPPADKVITKGLETVIFTYRRTDAS